MNTTNPNADWHHWFNRWETMQNCYVPQRLYRFDLMLRLADLSRKDEVQILDLGCGPGSAALRALQSYPNVRVVAVDRNPILLTMGREITADEVDHRIHFVQADIREADWWTAYEGTFDLVLSATALHWLSADNLAQLYRRIFRALKSGGWFMMSDHVASGDPNVQARYQSMRNASQQSAFHTLRADDWEGFWHSLGQALGQKDLLDQADWAETWEGTDDGHPKQFHVDTLEACGFGQVTFHWQDLGEAVVAAKKL